MIVAWALGVVGLVCYYNMILQHSTMTDVQSKDAPTLSYNSYAKSFQRPVKSSTMEDQQKQQAARKNQAWVLRKFALGDQIAAFKKKTRTQDPPKVSPASTAQSPASGGVIRLPNWLAEDAHKKVQMSDGDDVLAPGDLCKSFNHTVLHPAHGCQANPDTRQVFCNFFNLRIDNSLINVSSGGEKLEAVMGRTEDEELPKYSKGAFSVRPKPNFEVPSKLRVGMHFMETVLNKLLFPTKKNKGNFDSRCVETRPGTTLMITRYEYVNLYHTLSDWWNALAVLLPQQLDRSEAIRILFLDGHAEGNLDAVWHDVFGPYEHVKHLPAGGVCFERAVFVPPGYTAPIFPDVGKNFDSPRQRCPKTRMARVFSQFFLAAYGLQAVTPIPGKVVIIDRQPYVSHPRSNPDAFGRTMNLGDLEQQLRSASKATSVEIVRFETLTFADQIRKVREAQVLIGNHGAGITNLIFMDANAHVLEYTFDFRDFFTYLAEWKGIRHRLIPIANENHLSETDLANTVSIVNQLL